jgi:hypothetical protein
MVGRFTSERLTAFFTAIIAITGVVALAYAHLQLREAHKEAQIQHLLAFDHEYRQEPMISYRRGYATKRLTGIEDPPEETRLLDFFETIGLLVNHGYLTDTDVWETFATDIIPLRADARDTMSRETGKSMRCSASWSDTSAVSKARNHTLLVHASCLLALPIQH